MGERHPIAFVLDEHLPTDDGRACLVCRKPITAEPCTGLPRPSCRPMLGGETGEREGVTITDHDGWGILRVCTADDARTP